MNRYQAHPIRPSLAYRLLTAVVALECIAVIGWVFLFWLPGSGS